MRTNQYRFLPFFNSTERTIIYSAVEEAGEYLKDFYCFAPHEWFNHCYDVRTEGDGDTNTADAHAFAEVRQYRPVLQNVSYFPQDRYQIYLYDRNILKTLWRYADLEFYPFMLYILTHELIHIARFCEKLHPYDCDSEALAKEEEKVDRLTREVLRTYKSQTFCQIGHLHRHVHSNPPSPAGTLLL